MKHSFRLMVAALLLGVAVGWAQAANENARRDANHVTTMLGVTNDTARDIRRVRIDPNTGGLLSSNLVVVVAERFSPAVSATNYVVGTAIGAPWDLTIGATYSSFLVQSAAIANHDLQSKAANLYLYKDSFTGVADRTAATATDDEISNNLIGVIKFTAADYAPLGGNSPGYKTGLAMACNLGSTVVRAQWVAVEEIVFLTASSWTGSVFIIPQ